MVSVATTPQHNSLPMHINMHYTPTTTHPTAFHNPPLHTTNKHKAYLPRVRMCEGVKQVVLSICWSVRQSVCHSVWWKVTCLAVRHRKQSGFVLSCFLFNVSSWSWEGVPCVCIATSLWHTINFRVCCWELEGNFVHRELHVCTKNPVLFQQYRWV